MAGCCGFNEVRFGYILLKFIIYGLTIKVLGFKSWLELIFQLNLDLNATMVAARIKKRLFAWEKNI